MAYLTRPAKRDVIRIAARVARRHGLGPDVLFSHLYERRVVRAREEAQIRILKETGCSMGGLAGVWGCDRKSVVRAVEKAKVAVARRPTKAGMAAVAQHRAAIQFLYPERAEAIFAGIDPATRSDVDKWNAIGRKVAA